MQTRCILAATVSQHKDQRTDCYWLQVKWVYIHARYTRVYLTAHASNVSKGGEPTTLVRRMHMPKSPLSYP